MFDNFKRERKIRRVLSGLARQRVALVLQPHRSWVIELALKRDDETEAALMTCLMRGWIAPLQEDVPTGSLTHDMKLPSGPMFTQTEMIYLLTEGGWNALNRMHAWTAAGVLVAIGAAMISIVVAA